MNEAERCDRISLMNAGKVLAVGTPAELVRQRGCATLEDAFISYLEEASGIKLGGKPSAPAQEVTIQSVAKPPKSTRRFDLGRLWAYTRREAMELIRDHIRLVFATLVAPIVMIVIAYGVSLDVENVRFAAFDQDQTKESRDVVDAFSSSPRWFAEIPPPISSSDELDYRFRSDDVTVAVEIPPKYGSDLIAGRSPEIGVWIDGAMPFRAETVRRYVQTLAATLWPEASDARVENPVDFEIRLRYNQSFESVVAEVPNTVMLVLILIPAVMAAVGVVKEKETGSIANFYSTPITRFEFLLGKQLPYIGASMISYVILILLSVFLFHVPVKGSFLVLTLGTLLYVGAATGFGQLISTFTKTQVSAVFATTVIAMIPAANFSGVLVPVSSLGGLARVFGLSFPPAWYQVLSVGAFTKGLGFEDLRPNLAVLAAFFLAYLVAAVLILQKQER
jgi:ribosome-dependent ATPase